MIFREFRWIVRRNGSIPHPEAFIVVLKLVIGNKNYSSWSLRPWIMMRSAAIEFDEVQIPLRRPNSLARKRQYSPAGKVPVLCDGPIRVWESLAILEHLAERHPNSGLWPSDVEARAAARSVSAEMHAGFPRLRSSMFFNCRAQFSGKGRAPGVEEEIARICEIWRGCREQHGGGGEFLFGEFTIADAMFAPVILRFQTYEVELDPVSRAYSDATLKLPYVREWVAAARTEPWTIPEFEYA